MENTNIYISSIDFINNLTFSYVETYSFQRGDNHKNYISTRVKERQKLEVRKVRRNNLTPSEEERFIELSHELNIALYPYIINDKGQFHVFSVKVNTFTKGDSQLERLKNILQTEIKNVPQWMCRPVYRDAIVFYDEMNRIVAALNVCLSCQYMSTGLFNHINADTKTYKLFREFFKDAGHKFEEYE